MNGHKTDLRPGPSQADTGSKGKEVVMTSLPDRPDLHQLRIQAKELKRALVAGEQEALDRLLESHPKFTGRPAERAEGWTFTLRDAQVTIARELGFESWKKMVDVLEGPTTKRWNPSADSGLSRRAFREMQELRSGFCGEAHFLLALLNPDEPTIASTTLAELGVSHDKVVELSRGRQRASRTKAGGSTPMYHLILGWAQGMATGLGTAEVTDEIALLALAYGTVGQGSILETFDIDADLVVESLKAHGVATPPVSPPISTWLMGPLGPWVYFPKEEFSTVTRAVGTRYPPGRAIWGTNKSHWKRDFWYVHGEDEIPMEEIVRKALKGKTGNLVEVLPLEEGLELESAIAPRRYRDRQTKETE